VVAATLEKAKTYIFAEPLVWDREVGGSNPLAPTNYSQQYRRRAAQDSAQAVECLPMRRLSGFVAVLLPNLIESI